MAVIRASNNPNKVIEEMARSNPQMKEVMDLIQKSGNDPMKAFRNLAKEKGLDADEILRMISRL